MTYTKKVIVGAAVAAVGLLSASALAKESTVYHELINATTCHVAIGSTPPHEGDGVPVVFFTADVWSDPEVWTSPKSNETYSVPIVLVEQKFMNHTFKMQYAIVDNGDNADKWKVPYSPSDRYILSYDKSDNSRCNNPGMPYQCVIFAASNPCA